MVSDNDSICFGRQGLGKGLSAAGMWQAACQLGLWSWLTHFHHGLVSHIWGQQCWWPLCPHPLRSGFSEHGGSVSLHLFMAGDFQGTGTGSQQPVEDSMYKWPSVTPAVSPWSKLSWAHPVQGTIEIDCSPGGRGWKVSPWEEAWGGGCCRSLLWRMQLATCHSFSTRQRRSRENVCLGRGSSCTYDLGTSTLTGHESVGGRILQRMRDNLHGYRMFTQFLAYFSVFLRKVKSCHVHILTSALCPLREWPSTQPCCLAVSWGQGSGLHLNSLWFLEFRKFIQSCLCSSVFPLLQQYFKI